MVRDIYTVANGQYRRYIHHFTEKSDTHVKIHYHDRGQACVERCTEMNRPSEENDT